MLQIHDPANVKPEVVVGIDFGTTNSLVAFSLNHRPYILGDDLGFIKSIVHYQDGWQVGLEQHALVNIASVKRILGKTYEEAINLQALCPHLKQLLCQDQSKLYVNISGKLFDPTVLASAIFAKLKTIAQDALAEEVNKAVVTVPAYFDDRQKAAVKKAANLAGIEVIRLLNEPTSAGFAYGINYAHCDGQYLVYDFGGGTFDVSLLKIHDKITQVIAVAGDSNLGGDDIDQAISVALSKVYSLNIPFDIARTLKEQLLNQDIAAINYQGVELKLDKATYEKLALPFVNKTIQLLQQVLADAHDVKGIILIGGSSRMPLVSKLLSQFALPLLHDIDPDKAVAFGAAIQAENLSRSKSHLLLDVVPLSLGLEVIGGLNEKIILRNCPIPASAKRHFTTYVDNQTAIKLQILQGEREMARDCYSIGFFELGGIPPMPAGMAKIEVSFIVDADGLLYVSATECSSNISQELIVKVDEPKEEEVIQVVRQAIESAEIDHQERILLEAIVKAENFIAQVNKLLVRLNHSEEKIKQAVVNLQLAIDDKNLVSIQAATESLDTLFSPICAKYFNTQISSLLRGQSVD